MLTVIVRRVKKRSRHALIGGFKQELLPACRRSVAFVSSSAPGILTASA